MSRLGRSRRAWGVYFFPIVTHDWHPLLRDVIARLLLADATRASVGKRNRARQVLQPADYQRSHVRRRRASVSASMNEP